MLPLAPFGVIRSIHGVEMTKTLACLLTIACFCFPAFTQTPDACRAAVQHLTLIPQIGLHDSMLTAWAKAD